VYSFIIRVFCQLGSVFTTYQFQQTRRKAFFLKAQVGSTWIVPFRGLELLAMSFSSWRGQDAERPCRHSHAERGNEKKAILVLYPISHFSTRIFNPLIQCGTVTLKAKSLKKKVYIIRKLIRSPSFRIQGAVNRMK